MATNLEWLWEHDRDALVKVLSGDELRCSICPQDDGTDAPTCDSNCEVAIYKWLHGERCGARTREDVEQDAISALADYERRVAVSIVCGADADIRKARDEAQQAVLRCLDEAEELARAGSQGEEVAPVAEPSSPSGTPGAENVPQRDSSDARVPREGPCDCESTVDAGEDSREKLESDCQKLIGKIQKRTFSGRDATALRCQLYELLNRQAAITEREWIDTECAKCAASENERDRDFAELQERVDELTAENKDLREENDARARALDMQLGNIHKLEHERNELLDRVDYLEERHCEFSDPNNLGDGCMMRRDETVERLRGKVRRQAEQLRKVQEALEKRNGGEMKRQWADEREKLKARVAELEAEQAAREDYPEGFMTQSEMLERIDAAEKAELEHRRAQGALVRANGTLREQFEWLCGALADVAREMGEDIEYDEGFGYADAVELLGRKASALKAENEKLSARGGCPGYDADGHRCRYHDADFDQNNEAVRSLKSENAALKRENVALKAELGKKGARRRRPFCGRL